MTYFLSTPGAVEIEKLHLNSPALQTLKSAGVKLAVPMVSQGELVGLLTLGPRLSEQDYSRDDRELLNRLAIQAAPAIRVAQLARMNSSGIGLLVTLVIRTNRQKQCLLACGLSDHYQHIFRITRLSEAIGIYDAETEAFATAGNVPGNVREMTGRLH